jgi:hypothetical protein
MNLSEKFGIAGVAFFALVVMASLYGYVSNIEKMIGALGGEITALFIARCAGIFFMPLGSILGFF